MTIQLETETTQENNLVLNASKLDTDRTSLDANDKILLEDTALNPSFKDVIQIIIRSYFTPSNRSIVRRFR